MAQNTNAEAFLRLKPLQSDVGAITEEHIRFWKKYKDAEEAQELARKARQAEIDAKRRSKENEFVLENLGLGDSSSYFREQIVSDYERRKPEITALARRAFQGDTDAILRLDTVKQEFKELVSLDKTSGAAIKKFMDSSDKRNPILDRNKELFANNVAHGNYRIKDGKIDFLGHNGQIANFSAQQMRNSLNSLGEYSGKFDPTEFGENIAKTIKLDDVNGNKRSTEQIRLEGIKKVQNAFTQDSIASKSWILSRKNQFNGSSELTDSEFIQSLDKVQLTRLATDFYDEEVARNLQQVDRSLANANTGESIKTKRSNRQRKERLEDLQFAIATEDGANLTVDLEKVGTDIFNTELSKGGKAFTISNGKYDVGSGSIKTREFVEGGILKDGNIQGLIVKKTTETPLVEVPKELKLGSQYNVKTNRGEERLKLKAIENNNLIFTDSEDKEISIEAKKSDLLPIDTGKKTTKTITRYVTDKAEINAIGNRIGLGNEEGIRQGAISVIGEKTNNNAEGDLIFDN